MDNYKLASSLEISKWVATWNKFNQSPKPKYGFNYKSKLSLNDSLVNQTISRNPDLIFAYL